MCATGAHIEKARLVCRKSGQGQQDFLTVVFSNCLVSSYKTVGNMPIDPMYIHKVDTVLPTDLIRLNFARIEIEYKEQNNDGSMGAVIQSGYDLKRNIKI